MKNTKPTLADLRRLRAAAQEAAASQAVVATPTPPLPHRPLPSADPVVPTDSTLDAKDRALFRQAMRLVQPLKNQDTRARASLRHIPDAQLQARRAHAQGAPDTLTTTIRPPRQRHHQASTFDSEAEEFLLPGCGPDLLRGLRRGKWIAQATLDLHGSTADEARERLDRFLSSCLEHNIRCVRIIHGKGIGSRQGAPVLKAAVRQHLSRLEAIQAWIQGGEHEGGAGAVTALLRLPPQ